MPKIEAKLKDGYTRVYTVIRVHDGKAEKLKTTLNEDGTLTFETDKFSTYAITYEDVSNEASPTTGDKVIYSVILLGVSVIGLVAFAFKKRLFKQN